MHYFSTTFLWIWILLSIVGGSSLVTSCTSRKISEKENLTAKHQKLIVRDLYVFNSSLVRLWTDKILVFLQNN